MRGIASKDSASLRALFDRHAARVLAVCKRIMHDSGDAEDVLTEVFFELWTRSERYDSSRGSALVYLLTLARSRSIDRKRSKSSRKAGGSTATSLPEFLGSAAESTVEIDPFYAAEADEQGVLVRRALGELDPNQRVALECAYFDGLSHTEIAEKLHKPLGTIKTYIRQGLIRLKEQFRKES